MNVYISMIHDYTLFRFGYCKVNFKIFARLYFSRTNKRYDMIKDIYQLSLQELYFDLHIN